MSGKGPKGSSSSSKPQPEFERGRPKHRGPAQVPYESDPSDDESDDLDDSPITDVLFAFVEEKKIPPPTTSQDWGDAVTFMLRSGVNADAEEVLPLMELAQRYPETLSAMHSGYRARSGKD